MQGIKSPLRGFGGGGPFGGLGYSFLAPNLIWVSGLTFVIEIDGDAGVLENDEFVTSWSGTAAGSVTTTVLAADVIDLTLEPAISGLTDGVYSFVTYMRRPSTGKRSANSNIEVVTVATADNLLLETGDVVLLETGDGWALE
jgi:hypothetical protein